VSNSSICREVAQWLKKNDQAADISDATILRAVASATAPAAWRYWPQSFAPYLC
jgi:hypothetical protein